MVYEPMPAAISASSWVYGLSFNNRSLWKDEMRLQMPPMKEFSEMFLKYHLCKE